MIVKPGATVFHGSYCEVKEPDLDRCRQLTECTTLPERTEQTG